MQRGYLFQKVSMNIFKNNSFSLTNSVKQFAVHDHIIFLFKTSEEQRSVIVPYIKNGLQRGEKCIYLVGDTTTSAVMDFLVASEIDVDTAQASGALVILDREKSLIAREQPTPDEAIAILTAHSKQAQAEGFPLLRIIRDITWIHGNGFGAGQIAEYKLKLHNFISKNPVIIVSQYNLTLFPCDNIKDALYTYPLVIWLDTLCRNPYYMPPDEFLAQNDTSREVERFITNMVEQERMAQRLAINNNALDQVHEAAILMDDQGWFHYVNQEACRSLGYSRDELLSMAVPDINPDYTFENLPAGFERLSKLSSLTFETRHRSKDGHIFSVEAATSLFEHGGCRYVLSLARDITERKRTEEALRESEERFRNMFEKHNAVMLLIEPESGSILDANKAAEKFYGYPPEQLKNMLIGEINTLPPEHVAQEREKAVREKRNYFIFPHQLANGETRIVEVHSSPISIQGQSILFSVIHDITERKRMEEALVLREQEFRTLAENSPDNIVRYDREGYALYVNPSLEKTLGIPARDIIGKKIIGPQATERMPGYRDMLQKVIATGVNAEMEMRFSDRCGNILHHQIKFVPERDHKGAMISILAIGRDITELKQAEQALLDKQQRLSSITVELSLAEERERRRIATELHDNIGQDLILAQIKLGVLAKSSLTNAEAGILDNTREILGSIIQRVRFLTHMISPPILESGGLEAALKWLTRQMEADYCLQIAFADDTRKKNLSKEIQSVLYHAVRELLINIAKHAECSAASVSVGRNDDNIVINIEDDGVGFDSNAIEENLAQGSGFGLINVRRRIYHLGGTFTIESSPGTGTRITITMPLTKNRTKT